MYVVISQPSRGTGDCYQYKHTRENRPMVVFVLTHIADAGAPLHELLL